MGVAPQGLFRAQANRLQRLFHHAPGFCRCRLGEKFTDRRSQRMIDFIKGIVDLKGILKDRLHFTAEGAPLLVVEPPEILPTIENLAGAGRCHA